MSTSETNKPGEFVVQVIANNDVDLDIKCTNFITSDGALIILNKYSRIPGHIIAAFASGQWIGIRVITENEENT